MQPNPDDLQCVQVGVSVFPTKPPPPPPPPKGLPDKLLALLRKYAKFQNWRLDQLSKPKPPVSVKYIAPVVGPRYDKKKEEELEDHTAFYADHSSRPPLRTLVINKRLWGRQNGVKYRKKMRNRITKSWASIYNYYKKKERDRRLRRLRMEQPDKTKKKLPKTFKRTEALAVPRCVKLPPKKQKKKKIFSAYKHLDVMAAPSPRPEPPPKRVGLNPAALTCVASEATIKLAQLPERWFNIPKPLVPGQVRKSALKYKITPRIAALAVPRPRSEKAKTEDDSGPGTISKSALTYKATPRIIELAKPIERD